MVRRMCRNVNLYVHGLLVVLFSLELKLWQLMRSTRIIETV